MFIIYKTSNLINNKIYIGIHKTENINDSYLGSGIYLKKAIDKYGKENFIREILFEYTNDEEDLAWSKEKELVNREFVLRKDNYNLSIGGYKMSVMVGEHNPFYGKTHTEEFKSKISLLMKGKKLPDEHKKKISISSKKMWEDEEFKRKWIEKRIGKKKTYTEEGMKRLRDGMINRIVSDETKQKMSDYRKKFFAEMTPEEKEIWYEKNFTEERSKKLSESLKGKKRDWVAEKINRNPEKIRKTAEKHRGMKRSEETKKRISESKKGKPSNNKGKRNIHNPITKEVRMLERDIELPDGFVFGTGRFGKRK